MTVPGRWGRPDSSVIPEICTWGMMGGSKLKVLAMEGLDITNEIIQCPGGSGLVITLESRARILTLMSARKRLYRLLGIQMIKRLYCGSRSVLSLASYELS